MSANSYIKIAYTIKHDILNGSYQAGQQLPSIRLIAKQENCNPATVHRAFKVLKQQGIIFPRCSSGYFVINDSLKIDILRKQECINLISDFLDKLHAFGYSNIDIYMLLQNYLKSKSFNAE